MPDAVGSTALVTVGYEGRTAEELVGLLAESGVSVLVDVRLTPLSRKPGLSKRGLAERLSLEGIGYLHLPGLGNPTDNRESFRLGEQHSRRRFAERLAGAEGQQALAEVVALIRQAHHVALLCFEHDAASCHRRLVSDELARADPGLRVRDL